VKLSPAAKVGVGIGALVALVLFAIVVDLGVNAGRIHYGVSVDGVDLGGLTRREAIGELEDRSEDLAADNVILLTAVGLNVGVRPDQLGWTFNPRGTVRYAYSVGRTDAPFGALSDRVGSWLWGTKVDLRGTWDDLVLRRKIDEWDERLSGLGRPIDRDALEALIRKAVADGDPGPHEIPLESG
jgi:hypothetical protein